MKRILLTHIIPKEKAVQYRLSVAAINFSYNLIDTGIFDAVYSINTPNLIAPKGELKDERFITIYSYFRYMGGIGRKIAPIIENILFFFKVPKDSSIWLYNMQMLNVWSVVLLRIFKPSVKINTIVLDFTPGAKYNNYMLKHINRSASLIKLSESSLFTVENSVCLPGIVPDDVDYPSCAIHKKFMLSGVLKEEISMISMVIEVFGRLQECELIITGICDDEEYIKEKVKPFPNIVYYGMVGSEQYIELLHGTTFVLSTRDSSYPENQCNFPSKILESILHNRIIVSTIRYPQLKGINYFVVSQDKEEMMKDVKEIVSTPILLLEKYANQSLLAKNLFSQEVWSRTIKKLEKAN